MAINKKKLNLLYDASFLINYFKEDKAIFAGVSFSAYNILKEFEKQQIFNIILLFNSGHELLFKIKNDPFFSKFSYYKYYNEQHFYDHIELINTYKKNIKTTDNFFLKIIYSLKILKYHLYDLCHHVNNKYILIKTNIFLAPDSVIYNEIKDCTHIQKYGILHDVIPLLFPEYYPNLFYSNDHIAEYARLRNLNKETYYFCDSQCTKSDYLKYYSDQLDEKKMIVTLIASSQNFYPEYNKIKLAAVFDKYKVNYRDNDSYIFSLCLLDPRKNLIFTLNCFIKFIKKHNIDNLYFYLGGAIFNELVKEQINNLNEYRDRIVHLGYIDNEDVNILYSNSLFFTYISQYEGFGMPPLEAMQAGTPVITSNNSSLPEVVGDAAIMIDYDSEEQCIKAFEDLYFNEDLRKHYIEKGLERAKLFSWEKTVNKMSDFILNNFQKK
jgi:glycosyltransferase involved in cell wall biosynthesis